jgi:hypothetical protein
VAPSPDPLNAIVAFLKEDDDVVDATSGRIFNTRLPKAELDVWNSNGPRAALLIRPAGGGSASRSYLPLGDVRIDAYCYGPSDKSARAIWLAVNPALKQMRRKAYASCWLHWAMPAGGPLDRHEAPGDWPVCWSSYQVRVSEVAVA